MTRRYGVAANYVGRQFDLLAVQDARPVGDVLLAQTMFSTEDAGEVCTGAQKVAQRWLLHFLTVRGSMCFLPDDGTDFMVEAKRGAWHSEEDVREAYDFAAADTALYMIRDENENMHPEDRFQQAELLELTILSDRSVSLTVKITTQAGTDRKVILPIPFSPITTAA